MKIKSFMKIRLSLLMFLQLFIFGLIMPIMSLYLIKCLNFSGRDAGIIMSVSGVTMFISPVIGTLIADKLISVERLVSLCNLLGSVFMFILSYQTSFVPVMLFYLVYMLITGCTSGFVTAIVFHHETDAKKNFGSIRLWGSIGWISAAWAFSYFWLNGVDGDAAFSRLGGALKLSAVVSLIMAAYTLTFPKSKADISEKKSILPVEAISVMIKPKLLLLSALIFLTSVVYQYYSFGLAPFLQESGYKSSDIMPLMSLGQISEVLALALLGFFLVRTNYKIVLAIGLALNLWRFAALFLGSTFPLVLSGILSHGLYYAFFTTAASIYFDSHCDDNARSGVQQIIGLLSMGLGSFFGNLIAGQTATMFEWSNTHSIFWFVPMAVSIIMFILFFIFFKEEEPEKAPQPATAH